MVTIKTKLVKETKLLTNWKGEKYKLKTYKDAKGKTFTLYHYYTKKGKPKMQRIK